MKKFVQYSIVLAVILLLVFTCIELLLLLRPNTYSYKRNYVEEHINDIRVLLFGNSHIEEALIPDLMGEGVFNLAMTGRARIYDIELAKKYLPCMGAIEAVVMPLDYFCFYLGREISNPNEARKDVGYLKNTYKCMYYKYMNIRVDEPWYWSEILNSKLNYLTRFWYSDEDTRGCDSLGYIQTRLKERLSDWEYRNLPMFIDTKKTIDMEQYELLYDDFRTLADLSHQRGARLILIGTPVYQTYQEVMNKDVEKEMKVFVEKLKSEYPNVEYYDFTYDKRFEPDDFLDASHLTEFGAIKFSKIMAGIINTSSAK